MDEDHPVDHVFNCVDEKIRWKDSLFMNHNELRWMLLVAIGDCFQEEEKIS